MSDKPTVTFAAFNVFDKFKEPYGYFAWLFGIKGHPRLPDGAYIHTSLLVNVEVEDGRQFGFDEFGKSPDFHPDKVTGSKVVRIETLNTIYVKEAEPDSE